MKPKRLILWLIILVGAAAAYFLSGETERLADQERDKESRAVQLAGILEVATVELSGRAHPQPITIVREPKEHRWLITRPITYPADSMAISRLVGGSLDARIEKRVDNDGGLASYGLDPARVIIALKDQNGQEAILMLGDMSPTGNYLYAAPPNGDEIWFLPATANRDLSLDMFELRDKMVLEFVPASVNRIEITGDGEPLTLARLEKDGRKEWEFSDGEAASAEEVSLFLYKIHGLTAKQFLDGKQERARRGLERPRAQILLKLDDGSQAGLLLGGPAPDGRIYVARLGGGPVMEVESTVLAGLPPSQWDLAQRRIFDLTREQVAGLSIIRGDNTKAYALKAGAWTRTQPPGDAKAGEAASLFLYDLLPLKWEKVLKSGKDYGLDHPRLEIVLKLADTDKTKGDKGMTRRLSLAGVDEASGLVPARLAGDLRVFGLNPQILQSAP